jgi:anti-anti-sigma regulatory factor
MTETADATAGADQWHLVGGRWRPLHVQLAALDTAVTWARVGVEATLGAQDGDRGPFLSADLSMASVTQGRDYAVVVVAGAVTGAAVHQVRCQLEGLMAAGVRSLVVDVAGITGCDPGLGDVFDRLHRRLSARHGDVIVVNAPAHLRPVFAPEVVTEVAVAR